MPSETTIERIRESTWWLGTRAGAVFPLVLAAGGSYYLATGELVGLFVPVVVLAIALPCLLVNFFIRVVTEPSSSDVNEARPITEITEK
ncbi:hypothetical protein [Halorussus halophilus]|uniref:hypothetical protein n=1 Tax=Halorussus halophilus TaxID=2650975 RepID=UPI0013016876|nr:hypothetical protein [Halorussus halophilus]